MTIQTTQVVTAAAAQSALPTIITPVAEQQQYLTFSLGEEMFAIGILSIREILEYGELTEVPLVPPFIRGVINLRGAVVPVIDLAVRFARPRCEITKRSCVVIIEGPAGDHGQRLLMGVVVDAVSEVLEIPAAEIEPPPAFGANIRIDFISGMGKVNGRFVVLLDVNLILSLDEVSVVAALGKKETENQ